MNRHHADSPVEKILEAAARQAGIDAINAKLVRDGSNTIYELRNGVVARIGQPGTGDRARHELAVSRWLSEQEIPVVRPIADVPQNVVVNDRPVTWWISLPNHRAATPAELGRVLRSVHSLPKPDDLTLPAHDPFAGFDECVETYSVLANAERLWLKQRIDQLRAEYHETASPKVLHGDAWQGNVAVTESGETILLDLEHVSLGRQDWDLVLIAADYTDFARVTDSEYRSFVESYGGFDVTSLSDYRTLADIAECRWACFALKRAISSPQATREARHRIACLRGEHPRPWAWHAL